MLASGMVKEHSVCQVNDLQDNEMREFEITNGKTILLVKQNGEFSALGSKCTHYGAPLSKGALCNGRVRCPWHGACFNVKTGDIEDYPGLDSLTKFDVTIKDGKVMVLASEAALANASRTKSLQCKNANNNRTILIIGGGAAAQTCAETLRQEGFSGRLIMATKERHTPYDRPKLSKAMDIDIASILLRPMDYYKNGDIEILTKKEAKDVDILNKKVTFQDGQQINYDMLLIATGGNPVNVHAKNNTLKNVCLLRTPEDAASIARVSQGKDVVVNGASFIGMETASFLSEKAKSVTVISRKGIPFYNVFGEAIGMRLKKLFQENGVKFCDGRTIAEYRGKDGALAEILLDNGDVLKADICINGIGVRPNTDFILGSGIPVTTKGFIPVDKKMKTEANNVYAAGDIVQFPLHIAGDKEVSIGHWQMAHAHGRIAALNMLDKMSEIRSIPYFWTVLFKRSIRYAGYGEGFDDIIIDGDLEGLKFVAYYTRGDHVVAVASLNSDPVVSKFAEYLGSGKILTKESLRSDPSGWINHFH